MTRAIVHRALALLVLVVLATLASGCGSGGSTPSPRASSTPVPTQRAPDLPVTTPPPVPGVPASIVDAVRIEAARLSGVAVEQLVIVRAEPVTWSDGSLGCPQPGQAYTQALVDGYWIVIAAGAREYDFRVSDNGTFRLCELAIPRGSDPPGAEPVR